MGSLQDESINAEEQRVRDQLLRYPLRPHWRHLHEQQQAGTSSSSNTCLLTSAVQLMDGVHSNGAPPHLRSKWNRIRERLGRIQTAGAENKQRRSSQVLGAPSSARSSRSATATTNTSINEGQLSNALSTLPSNGPGASTSISYVGSLCQQLPDPQAVLVCQARSSSREAHLDSPTPSLPRVHSQEQGLPAETCVEQRPFSALPAQAQASTLRRPSKHSTVVPRALDAARSCPLPVAPPPAAAATPTAAGAAPRAAGGAGASGRTSAAAPPPAPAAAGTAAGAPAAAQQPPTALAAACMGGHEGQEGKGPLSAHLPKSGSWCEGVPRLPNNKLSRLSRSRTTGALNREGGDNESTGSGAEYEDDVEGEVCSVPTFDVDRSPRATPPIPRAISKPEQQLHVPLQPKLPLHAKQPLHAPQPQKPRASLQLNIQPPRSPPHPRRSEDHPAHHRVGHCSWSHTQAPPSSPSILQQHSAPCPPPSPTSAVSGAPARPTTDVAQCIQPPPSSVASAPLTPTLRTAGIQHNHHSTYAVSARCSSTPDVTASAPLVKFPAASPQTPARVGRSSLDHACPRPLLSPQSRPSLERSTLTPASPDAAALERSTLTPASPDNSNHSSSSGGGGGIARGRMSASGVVSGSCPNSAAATHLTSPLACPASSFSPENHASPQPVTANPHLLTTHLRQPAPNLPTGATASRGDGEKGGAAWGHRRSISLLRSFARMEQEPQWGAETQKPAHRKAGLSRALARPPSHVPPAAAALSVSPSTVPAIKGAMADEHPLQAQQASASTMPAIRKVASACELSEQAALAAGAVPGAGRRVSGAGSSSNTECARGAPQEGVRAASSSGAIITTPSNLSCVSGSNVPSQLSRSTSNATSSSGGSSSSSSSRSPFQLHSGARSSSGKVAAPVCDSCCEMCSFSSNSSGSSCGKCGADMSAAKVRLLSSIPSHLSRCSSNATSGSSAGTTTPSTLSCALSSSIPSHLSRCSSNATNTSSASNSVKEPPAVAAAAVAAAALEHAGPLHSLPLADVAEGTRTTVMEPSHSVLASVPEAELEVAEENGVAGLEGAAAAAPAAAGGPDGALQHLEQQQQQQQSNNETAGGRFRAKLLASLRAVGSMGKNAY